ncbi:DDE-1 domain-containing protein, partial [Aphis craccivora]
ISITTAKHNNNEIWRHKECLKCDYLFLIFKKYKKISLLINSKWIGPTLTPTRRRFLNNTLNKKKKYQKIKLPLTFKNKTATLTDSTLNTLFSSNNLSNSQKTIITEIINSSKAVKPNNRRYSEDWILLCILLKIRSSSTYLFLKEQEILPLPCTRTIRMYLSLINTQCGFDEIFFLLFKKKVAMLKKEEKHGVLVFDEIFLRESLQVNSQTLTYSGLENFGREIKSSGLKANHGLVFLFQSLGANFTQPIAVFASNGPVKGLVLAQ